MRWLTVLSMAAAMTITSAARAQAPLPPPPSPPILTNHPSQLDPATMMQEHGKKLLEKAAKSADGSANEILNQYNGYYTMLVARTRTGIVEVHTSYDDFFFVIDGEMTEAVGDAVTDGKPTTQGEIRGTKMTGGNPQVLRKGDVFHIDAGKPHMTTIAPGKTVVYFMVKVGVRK